MHPRDCISFPSIMFESAFKYTESFGAFVLKFSVCCTELQCCTLPTFDKLIVDYVKLEFSLLLLSCIFFPGYK